jgi:DNA invertase Pin-like site-specific DNA recombinase
VSLLAEQEFTRHGCQVLSADGLGVDKTVRELVQVMASAERRNLVARLEAGRRAKAARGGYAGGRPRIGYRAEGGELVVDEEAARAIRGMFSSWPSGGGAYAGWLPSSRTRVRWEPPGMLAR